MWNDGELIGEIFLFDDRSDRAVSESIDADRLEKQLALNESVGIRRFFFCSWSREH